MKFENTPPGLKELNTFLEGASYIEGYLPSQADVEVFAAIGETKVDAFPHIARWYKHIASYTEEERKAFPAPAAAKAEEKPAEEAKAEEDDDDFDLFETTEEDKAALEAERIRKADEMTKLAKEKGLARSQLVIDIKPWDDETPMDKLEAAVRTIELPGLAWGISKLVPIGYGIKKMSIGAVIIDDLVCTDDIEEKVMEISDYVQSMDVVSFNKL